MDIWQIVITRIFPTNDNDFVLPRWAGMTVSLTGRSAWWYHTFPYKGLCKRKKEKVSRCGVSHPIYIYYLTSIHSYAYQGEVQCSNFHVSKNKKWSAVQVQKQLDNIKKRNTLFLFLSLFKDFDPIATQPTTIYAGNNNLIIM